MVKKLGLVATAAWGAFAVLASMSGAFAEGKFAAGDADAGEDVFKKCMACHRVGEGAKNQVGPVLNGVLGRQAGTIAEYTYSELNKNAGLNGLVWTPELIFDYLEEPTPFLQKFLTAKGKTDQAVGATKMPFKLTDQDDRNNVIAYLKKFSPEKK